MKAITYDQAGPAINLKLNKVPKPCPTPNEVLIKVTASGVNRPDIFQRQGKYPAPPGVVPNIPGLEVSGHIVERGADCREWEIGQAVCALLPGGGYAEYVSVDAGSCLPIPKGFSLKEAAALPEVLFTVWHNIFQRGKLNKNENVLIYGGSGGIGSMAIQLVNLFGASAYSMASSEEKTSYCMDLGAVQAINYKEEDLIFTFGENKFDLILDSLGGKYFADNLKLLKAEGRLVYINAMEGTKPQLNILRLMQKRLQITGSTLRARSYTFKRKLRDDILLNSYNLLENEKFRPLVKYEFPLEKAAEAHLLMESRDFMGKIVLTT